VAGTHTVTATYNEASSALHASSHGSFDITVTTRATTTTVTCSPSTIPAQDTTTCHAVVADVDFGTKSDPSGSVTFSVSGGSNTDFDSTTCTLATPTASSSSCDVHYTPSAVGSGTHTINASYGGSSLHTASSDPDGFAVTVTTRATQTSVTCAPSTVAINQGSVCTAQVDDTDTGTRSNPAGTVSFSRSGAGTGNFSSASCTLAPIASDPDSSSCQVGYRPTSGAGTHTIRGDYSGSALHTASYGTFDLTVILRATSTSTNCVPTTVFVNQGSVCTITVTDTAAGHASDPAGTIAVHSSSTHGSFSGACTLAGNGNGSSSCTVTYTPSARDTGTHTITADYSAADSLHSDSSDLSGSAITVNLRTTSTSLSCTPSGVVVNQATTCTASVTDTAGSGATTPAGTVTFSSNSTHGSFNSTSCPLVAGSCSVTYTPSAKDGGTHTITASYSPSGSSNDVHAGSTSSGFGVSVSLRSTSTSVSCTSPVSVNQASSCTVTVTDTQSAGTKTAPDGSVSFTNTGSGSFSSPSCTLVHATSSTSTCSVNYTPSARGTGSHTVKASYTANDDVHANSADNTGSAITVNLRTTSTSLSCTPSGVVVNQATTCTASVTDTAGSGATTPAGTVTFSSNSTHGSFNSTSCPLVAGSCSVTYTPSAKDGGTHTITASYSPSGSSNDVHAGSTSSGFGVSVSLRSTSTSVSCLPSSVVVNQTTTCTATVTDTAGPGATTPAGTVSFSSDGPGSFSSSSCPLVAGTCSVTYTPSAQGTGTHSITAAYSPSGSSNDVHSGSTSSTFAVTVGRRATQTSVSCAPVVGQINASTTCTATVTDVDPAGGKLPPSGSVTFTSDGSGTFTPPNATCTLTTASSSSSTCNVTYKATSADVANINASYGGSAVHLPSGTSAATGTQFIVVFYDPSGGFVTGGGWILEPAYAGPPPIVVGDKSNFGFNAKYQKGASLPTGEMEFQYKAGNINFHGSSYDWLVVSQSGTTMKAEAQGSGTVNGAGNYAFYVVVTDGGGTDKFRIKIWDKVSGTVIYDTEYGTPIGSDPITVTGGGNIVIHK
jgi:large repetitive protein